MALSGYESVPFNVNIRMAGAIFDTYTVTFLGAPHTTISPSSLTFTNANWNTDQPITVTCTTSGTLTIPYEITAPYYPGKILTDHLTLTISVTPFGVWTGSLAGIDNATIGGNPCAVVGDLMIAYNNLLIGNVATLSRTYLSGYVTAAFATDHSCFIRVIDPDGIVTDSPGFSSISVTMNKVGVWTFYPYEAFATIPFGTGIPPAAQLSDWNFSTTATPVPAVKSNVPHLILIYKGGFDITFPGYTTPIAPADCAGVTTAVAPGVLAFQIAGLPSLVRADSPSGSAAGLAVNIGYTTQASGSPFTSAQYPVTLTCDALELLGPSGVVGAAVAVALSTSP